MDLLSIKDGHGFLNLPGKDPVEVSQVTPQNIADALETILDNDSICLGPEDGSLEIANMAPRIIFDQLRASFKQVIDSRATILGEINSIFSEAEAKYLK